MINKYQAGGAAPQGSILQEIAKLPQDKQKQIMAAFGKWAQAKGLNIQQLQGNEQALEQAMGQFLQEMQQAPKARLGAKLNYVRSLRGLAPEGMVTEYYKEGGQVKKKFVKPAGGAKEKDGKKEIADFKKKKACGGSKMKFADGGKPKAGKWTKEDDKKLLKYRLKGTKNPAEKRDSTEVQTKWNKLPEKVKKQHEVQEEKCGGKAKKHMFGGVIGFQAGGSFKDAWNAARKNKLRYFNWNGKMYNSKDKGNDVAYESFRDNMNEASAQLPTDKSPKHLGWDRNNPTSNEMRGNDREIRQQGTESVLPGITVIGTRRTNRPTTTARAGVNKNKATRNMSGAWGQGSGGGQQYANQRQYAFERSDFDKMRMKSAGIFGSTAYKTDNRGKRYVERDGNLYYDDGTYYSPQTRKTGKYTFTPGGLFSKNTFNLF